MEVTEPGIVMVVMLRQPATALGSMEVTESGIRIVEIVVQF